MMMLLHLKLHFWGYAAGEPEFGKIFNEAMASDSNLTMEVLMTQSRLVFEGLESLVDVGGGTGKDGRAIMLVLYGAKERTEKEWATLFSDADFSSYKIFPVLGIWCLIEVYP
ncbi:probable O-methyltransferase 3 [Coffea arabica]|uniref:Probable O-methyltransferase 3 n=1 Tax=Coffea arabica TaxID=13443 RepID=A0ABM4UFY5_COFAR